MRLAVIAGLLAAGCASRPADPFPVPVGDGLFILMVTRAGEMPNVRRMGSQISKAGKHCAAERKTPEIIVAESEESGETYNVMYFRCAEGASDQK